MPFLEHMKISNDHLQKDQQRPSTLLVFPHLKHLDLRFAHDDYGELFLTKKNTCLPRLSTLLIVYKSFRRIMNEFYCDWRDYNIYGLNSLNIFHSCTESVNIARHFQWNKIKYSEKPKLVFDILRLKRFSRILSDRTIHHTSHRSSNSLTIRWEKV